MTGAHTDARTVVIAVFDDASTCDPHAAFDSPSRQIVLNVYEGLVRPGAHGEVEPALAERWSVEPGAEGRSRFCFRLRSGVRFHEGADLAPADAVYSLRRALTTSAQVSAIWLDALLGRGAERSLAEVAAACELIRETEDGLEIDARCDFPALLSVLGTWGLIVSRRWAVASDLSRATNGTGPYRLVEWDRERRRQVFRRHAGYWGPAPAAGEVRLVSEDDRLTREGLLIKARADFSVCQPESLPRVAGDASVTVSEVVEDWHLNPLGFVTQRLDPGCAAVGSGRFGPDGIEPDALSDLDLRLALVRCFDYGRFGAEALGGRSNEHFGPFPRPALADGPQPTYAFDLEAARRHLAAAHGGHLARDGCRLVAYTHQANVAREVAARVLADGFNRLHERCRMDVVALPLGALSDLLYASACPIAWIGWDADYPHAHALASQLLDPEAILPRRLGIRSEALAAAWRGLGGRPEDGYVAMARAAIDEALYLFVPSKVGYLVYDRSWSGVRLKSGVSNVLDFASFSPAVGAS